jgi:porphobilinogen synthase
MKDLVPNDVVRMRRLRGSAPLREALAETRVRPTQLIQPHFVVGGARVRAPVVSLPGIDRVSVDELVKDVAHDRELGLKLHLLFGVPDEKDATGSAASDPEGPVARALKELRKQFGADVVLFTDVCLCGYTSHGHCGVVQDGRILNDPSVELLTGMALAHARAGADFVAPSDMMDGRVAAMRRALDAEGKGEVGILSYSAKFASSYYGPFREAAGSKPAFGDRRTYQMDLRNAREAVREIVADEHEGADMVMVKPALAYLDVIARARDATRLPVVAYNVSGEYSMVKAAAEKGWVDEAAVVRENLTAMARAGSDLIITYHGRAALAGKWLQ